MRRMSAPPFLFTGDVARPADKCGPSRNSRAAEGNRRRVFFPGCVANPQTTRRILIPDIIPDRRDVMFLYVNPRTWNSLVEASVDKVRVCLRSDDG